MRRAVEGIICAFALTVVAMAQNCGAPEDPGRFLAGWRTATVTRGTRSMSCRVYYPAITASQNATADSTGAPYAMIAFGHGFLAQNTYYNSYFEHLASRGYIVIAPQFVDTQHGQLALDLLACLQWLRGEQSAAGGFLRGIIDTSAAGVSGHSMGGGASLLAASYDSRIRIAAPITPAETSPSAVSAMPNIIGAVCLISGASDGITPPAQNQQPMYNAASAFKSLPLLAGANHTRFMDNPIGDWTDPNGSMTRPVQQLLARRYMTAAFDLFLKGDTCGWHYSYGALALDSRVSLSAATKYVAPKPFLLLSPIFLEDSIPPASLVFTWNRARTLNPNDSVDYTLQLSTGSRFLAVYLEQRTFDTSITLPRAQYQDTSYWRVVARNSPNTATISSNIGFFRFLIVPVEFLSFNAHVLDSGVELRWITTRETNNAGFEVERSVNHTDFVRVGFVPGAGSSVGNTTYSYWDPHITEAWYRLRQIDFDGKHDYSPVIHTSSRSVSDFDIRALYPQPYRVNDRQPLIVAVASPCEDVASLRLFNSFGRMVLSYHCTLHAGVQSVSLPFRDLAPGLYVVSLTTKGGNVANAKVLVTM